MIVSPSTSSLLSACPPAAGNRSVWNTLFLRQDTVAEAVAAHYGITKAQLLDRDAQDLPVRMALGEAQVGATSKARRVCQPPGHAVYASLQGMGIT
jgi:hypothetical protein